MIFRIFVTCLKVYCFEGHTEGLLHASWREKKCESQIVDIKIYFFANHNNICNIMGVKLLLNFGMKFQP